VNSPSASPDSTAGSAPSASPHQLPYHPARLLHGPIAEAASALQARGGQGLAILDLNPGRTTSWTYRRVAKSLNGAYLAPAADPVAYDLSTVKTVLTIGAPLLDGWGTPSKVMAARQNFRLIHAEAIESRTAVLADRWIPIAPGMERAFAQEILDALKEGFTSAIASELKANGPALVIGNAPEITEINRLLGAYGKSVVARAEAPVPEAWQKDAAPVTALETIPVNSIRTLLIDESAATSYIPWDQLAPKLSADSLTITFAATRGGYARHAKYALPIAIYPEFMDDLAPAVDSASPAWRLSIPLVTPPAVTQPNGLADPAEFAGALAGISASNTLRERAAAIHKTGLGTVTTYADGKQAPVKDLTPDNFWKAMSEGAIWLHPDAKPSSPPIPAALSAAATAETAADLPLMAIPANSQPALFSPLMTKLYQESNLRLAPNRVALHPDDARAANLSQGARAILQTRTGKCAVDVTIDASIPPGAVLLGSSPGIQDICGAASRAKVVRA